MTEKEFIETVKDCHGEDNPYLLFFLYIEQYSMLRLLVDGLVSYETMER